VINPENTRSIQLAERLGMTPGRELELQDKPFLEYYLENDNLV
jgi:RimJ/RimL family protein N-acetyltransferase